MKRKGKKRTQEHKVRGRFEKGNRGRRGMEG